jgi:hypothetical protein
MDRDLKWLEEVGRKAREWLLRQEAPGRPGHIRWAEEGALTNPTARAGLAPSCLALKTLFMLNSWQDLPENHRVEWVQRIRRFQKSHLPFPRHAFFDGPLLFRALTDAGLRQSRLSPLRVWDFSIRILRAETRQALSTLVEIGEKASPPPPGLLWKTDVKDFACRLDWSQPWAAASHVSSLLFFAAQRFEPGSDQFRLIQNDAVESLNSVFNGQTGAWHRGDATPEQIMNGAMKVLTGIVWLDIPISAPERLIDYCLNHPPQEHGCSLTDRVYVLQRCLAVCRHRTDEVREVARDFLRVSNSFFHDEGGFRYFPDRSQTHYHGARITEGRNVPDVHGTCLFVWGLVLSADILGWREELGWSLLRP